MQATQFFLVRLCSQSLQELSIRECSRVSDEAVAAVAAHGSLEALDVSGIPEIGAATVKALATACKCAPPAPLSMMVAPLSCPQAPRLITCS